jgi:hypothetical protein
MADAPRTAPTAVPPAAAAAGGQLTSGPARATPAAALVWPVPGAPPSAPPSPLPLTPARPRSIAPIQALDDAINYRLASLAIDCEDCQPGDLCATHDGAVFLLSVYRQMREQARAALPPYSDAPAIA